MLNEEARARLSMIRQIIADSKSVGLGAPMLGAYHTEWLAETLTWMNERYVEHVDCCISPCNDAETIKELRLEIDQLKGDA